MLLPEAKINFFVLGVLAGLMFDSTGILSGTDAVHYYAEVHTNIWNTLLHAITMPPATILWLVSVPSLLGLTPHAAECARAFIVTMMLVHYAFAINALRTVMVALLYIPVMCISDAMYNLHHDQPGFTRVTLTSAICIMLLAEVIGHTVFEGSQSRPDGVLNAILFSAYFAVNGDSV